MPRRATESGTTHRPESIGARQDVVNVHIRGGGSGFVERVPASAQGEFMLPATPSAPAVGRRGRRIGALGAVLTVLLPVLFAVLAFVPNQAAAATVDTNAW